MFYKQQPFFLIKSRFNSKEMYLVDGKSLVNSFNVNEFIDYFLFTKNNFENFLDKVLKEKMYPEKFNWEDICTDKWEKDNYINQVCGIRTSQISKLKKENILTIEKLAKIDPKKIQSKINPNTKIKLVKQAKLQEEKKVNKKVNLFLVNLMIFYKMLEGDIFYDIEGFPQANGFEYLHGIYFYNGTKFEFKDFTVKDYTKKKRREFLKS